MQFKIGQKWISNAEPELAIGQVIRIENRRVSIYFDLSEEDRTYATDQAPLSRVKFSPGDEIATQDGITITVTSVNDRDGIFVYHGDYEGTSTSVIETELDPNVRFSKPEDRLFTAQFDSNSSFHLRVMTRHNLAKNATSPVRGLGGPRIGLIPHQLYIASEVANRFAPRVLLADEVGLGKTIEAGLIMHQQLQTGRAERVLIIVPEALTFQWFVEMIRHFNLQFTILDEERCMEIGSDMTELDSIEHYNPFEAQQLMLCSLDLFTNSELRLAEALEADWDLIVVDEAHHLRYEEGNPSDEYRVVEELAKVSKGLLLLTATPEQLGKTGHFARLRLLDSDRFNDFEKFQAEEDSFGAIADAANALLDANSDTEAEAPRKVIRDLVGHDGTDKELISALLDRHGTGRVLFRNVRSSVSGFAARVPLPEKLDAAFDGALYPELRHEDWVENDPRIPWLVDLLEEDADEKFLLICRSQETVMTLEKKLNSITPVRTTLFHEGMDLVARDRAANYFADTDRGAQIMLCSEIGSEGRNFQFASHLVLFDLPLSPDLLEQRIGRLDRIGQRQDVKIHIPYHEGSETEVLYRLYDEGLNLFNAPNPVAQNLFNDISFPPEDATQVISDLANQNAIALANLQAGRDRLLELHSCDEDQADDIIDQILDSDFDKSLNEYMELSFDHFGLESDELDHKVWVVKPTESMQRNESISLETLGNHYYPELPEDGVRFTYHRETAQTREDVQFLTWESPMVAEALDAIASDFAGNSAMIAVKHPALKAGTLLVETISIVDCPSERSLMIDKYLPPKIIRHLIAPTLVNLSDKLRYESMKDYKMKLPMGTLKKVLESQEDGIKTMIEKARQLANAELTALVQTAQEQMQNQLDGELQRFKALAAVNPNIRQEEIDDLSIRKAKLEQVIQQAEVRLDAIRVIVAA